jgi:hypothetical protein
MDPDTLEVLMVLSFNKDWWDATSIQAIRQNMRKELQEYLRYDSCVDMRTNK